MDKIFPMDNVPNASKLLHSMRFLGYDDKSAICDILDNCIDADAKNIAVNVKRFDKDEFVIEIVDDGVGMTPEILDQAIRFGSKTIRSARSDLGRFGMGLTTASLSLGKRLEVKTKSKDIEPIIGVIDIDEMMRQNEFIRERFGYADWIESNEYESSYYDFDYVAKKYGQQLQTKQGTIVKITKTDGFKRMYVGAFQKDLIKHIGQVYRYFIKNGVNFYVNNEIVQVNDPLWLEQGAEEYSHEVYDIKIKNEFGEESEEPVRVRFVILPNHGGVNENKKVGYNVDKSGFYILRNNREIASAQTLGLITRHPDFIRFRAEIFITGSLDEVMGIEFTKRDVRPTQAVRDQLKTLLTGDIKSIRNRLKKASERNASDKMDHSKAERYISSMSRLLLTPPENVSSYEEEVLDQVCKFGSRDFGEEGPIYSAEQRGKTIYIDWNIAHPFYKTFILENQDNPEKILAADYLVYSMAAAELRTFDEDQSEFITNFKSVLSINLRTLLAK